MSRVGTDESPLSLREAPFMISVEASWDDPQDSDHNIAWVRECVAPLLSGFHQSKLLSRYRYL